MLRDGGRGSNLSQTIRYSASISSFKSETKTHLFRVVGNPSVFFVCCKKNYCCLFLWCGLFVSMCCERGYRLREVTACCRCKVSAWKYVRWIIYCRTWVKGSGEPADWTTAFKLEISSLTDFYDVLLRGQVGSRQNQIKGCCERQE